MSQAIAEEHGPQLQVYREPQVHTRLAEARSDRGMRYPPWVGEYRFTEYFETDVLRKRPYLKKEWCIRVVEQPLRSEPQEHNRVRFWAEVPELGGKILRVITLEDRLTIHNAFPDRGFKP